MNKRLLNMVVVSAIATTAAFTMSASSVQISKKAATVDIDKYVGGYVYTSQYVEEGEGSITRGARLEKVSADSVRLTGFCLATQPIGGKIVGDTLYIPSHQVAYTSSTFGSASVRRFYYNGYRYRSDDNPVRAIFESNGNIKFVDYCGLVVDDGAYAGIQSSNTLSPCEAEKANVEMSVTYNKKITASYNDSIYPVILSQEGNVVSINNFCNQGCVIKATINADSSLCIPKQFVFDGGEYIGTFYLYAAQYPDNASAFDSTTQITGDTIRGIATPEALSWGNFAIFSTGHMYMGAPSSARVSYVDGSKFQFSNNTAVDEHQLNREVADRVYYDLTGRASHTPFSGINVVVTRFADGTSATSKELHR